MTIAVAALAENRARTLTPARKLSSAVKNNSLTFGNLLRRHRMAFASMATRRRRSSTPVAVKYRPSTPFDIKLIASSANLFYYRAPCPSFTSLAPLAAIFNLYLRRTPLGNISSEQPTQAAGFARSLAAAVQTRGLGQLFPVGRRMPNACVQQNAAPAEHKCSRANVMKIDKQIALYSHGSYVTASEQSTRRHRAISTSCFDRKELKALSECDERRPNDERESLKPAVEFTKALRNDFGGSITHSRATLTPVHD